MDPLERFGRRLVFGLFGHISRRSMARKGKINFLFLSRLRNRKKLRISDRNRLGRLESDDANMISSLSEPSRRRFSTSRKFFQQFRMRSPETFSNFHFLTVLARNESIFRHFQVAYVTFFIPLLLLLALLVKALSAAGGEAMIRSLFNTNWDALLNQEVFLILVIFAHFAFLHFLHFLLHILQFWTFHFLLSH